MISVISNRFFKLGCPKICLLGPSGSGKSIIAAKYVAEHMQKMIDEQEGGRVSIHSVECRENDKNSALYYPNGIGGDGAAVLVGPLGDE